MKTRHAVRTQSFRKGPGKNRRALKWNSCRKERSAIPRINEPDGFNPVQVVLIDHPLSESKCLRVPHLVGLVGICTEDNLIPNLAGDVPEDLVWIVPLSPYSKEINFSGICLDLRVRKDCA